MTSYQRWKAYAVRAGLIDENGVAQGDPSCAQTSWHAWEAAEKNERERCLAPVFDGWLVYCALDDKAKARTSRENVTDTLDAYARLIKMRSIRFSSSYAHTETR